MEEANYEWHTRQNKQDRSIKVMVKNLHQSCSPKEISEELSEEGFKIEMLESKLKQKRD